MAEAAWDPVLHDRPGLDGVTPPPRGNGGEDDDTISSPGVRRHRRCERGGLIVDARWQGSPVFSPHVWAFGDLRVPLEVEPTVQWMQRTGESCSAEVETLYHTSIKLGEPFTDEESFMVEVEALGKRTADRAHDHRVRVYRAWIAFEEVEEPIVSVSGHGEPPEDLWFPGSTGRCVWVHPFKTVEMMRHRGDSHHVEAVDGFDVVRRSGRERRVKQRHRMVIDLEP